MDILALGCGLVLPDGIPNRRGLRLVLPFAKLVEGASDEAFSAVAVLYRLVGDELSGTGSDVSEVSTEQSS